MKKIMLLAFLVIGLGVAGYLFYSPTKNVEEKKEAISALLGTDKNKQVDLLKLQEDLEALSLKGKKRIDSFAKTEKELAGKDKTAEELIKKLNAEHGVTEAEFKERYNKVFEKFKNKQSAQ